MEDNKALVRRWIEGWNRGKELEVTDEVYDANYILHDPGNPGLAGLRELKGALIMYRTAFPDFHITIEELIAEGDKVIVRYTDRGTHKGDFMGIPPTGKRFTATGIGINRISGGKIVEGWANWDMLGLMQQLGILPQIGEGRK